MARNNKGAPVKPRPSASKDQLPKGWRMVRFGDVVRDVNEAERNPLRRAYQRKVAVAEFDGICSSDILTFEPKDDVLLPELLPFIVRSEGFFEHALGTSSGSLSPRTR